MKKIVLVMALGFISSSAMAQTEISSCSVVPSCEELGYIYTETDCGDKETVKCPFGDGLYCDLSTVKTCGFGDLIYPDRRCFSANPPDETPLGIVIDPLNRIALALDIEENSNSTNNPDYNIFMGNAYSTLFNNNLMRYDSYSNYNTTPWDTPCYNFSTYDSTTKFPTDAANYMSPYITDPKMFVHTQCESKGSHWSVPAIGAFVYWRNTATSAQKIAFEETLASISKPSVTGTINGLTNKYYVSHVYCPTSTPHMADTYYPYAVTLKTTDSNSATMEKTAGSMQQIQLSKGLAVGSYVDYGAFLRCVMKY